MPVILRHGGHANKFIDDGLPAVLGARDRLSDQADRAVGAAIEVACLVRERYGGEVRVASAELGSIVVGTIGGGGRLDFAFDRTMR